MAEVSFASDIHQPLATVIATIASNETSGIATAKAAKDDTATTAITTTRLPLVTIHGAVDIIVVITFVTRAWNVSSATAMSGTIATNANM